MLNINRSSGTEVALKYHRWEIEYRPTMKGEKNENPIDRSNNSDICFRIWIDPHDRHFWQDDFHLLE